MQIPPDTSNVDPKTQLQLAWKALFLIAGFSMICLYSGLIEWLLWRWFLVPIGAPAIGYWHVAGISILVTAMTQDMANTKAFDQAREETKSEDPATYVAKRYPLLKNRVIFWTTVLALGFSAKHLAGL